MPEDFPFKDFGSAQSFSDLREFLQDHLLERIVPFWTKHAVDPEGGLNTCIRDDGTLVSRDKWLWSQWRAVWVFSRLYNQIEKRPEWLDIAQGIYRFTSQHGWDDNIGGWRLLLSGDGEPIRGCESIYTEGFAISGMIELAKATGSAEVLALARKTADQTLRRLEQPHDEIPHFPYPVPSDARVHGIPMIFSLVFWELGQYLDHEPYREAARKMSDEIFSNFYQPDLDLIVERISADGSPLAAPLGTAVVPGHVIEDMWFQIHIARDEKNRARIEEAVRLTERHAEVGWDSEYGGFFLAIDAKNNPEIAWDSAEAKIWWPHTEALYTFLLAYEESRDSAFLDWYQQTHEYSFATFPDRDHGEWKQKLTRQGEPLKENVALPVKDPFHLPRALLLCLEVLERLENGAAPRRS